MNDGSVVAQDGHADGVLGAIVFAYSSKFSNSAA